MAHSPIREEDIARLVPTFYGRVRQDSLLGPIFNDAVTDWAHHLATLQDFWSSVLLASGRYKGQPMIAHVRHEDRMSREAFGRWLDLWRQTTSELFEPAMAAMLQEKADRIAESLQLGMSFYRDRKSA
ncbi:group III truncated hemoglobin [Novosphingobium panipatense]|jgi:hemoglobin|uniref:group III truncated hemoglobin n=1 Tax=Novosphingobium TaxID=165696 RepID=UPI000CDA9188|nr:group III truncated hemoglobin [Novosphingobium sp. HII-3]